MPQSTVTNSTSKLLLLSNTAKSNSNTNTLTNTPTTIESIKNLDLNAQNDLSTTTSAEPLISSLENYEVEEKTFGSEIWSGEAKYVGGFKDHQKHGYGVLQFKDGLHYKGQFELDNISGYGIASWPDKTYEGYWKNNQKHGKGKETYNDGRTYQGDFFNDRKEGYGEFKWANKSCFKGLFLNGKQHGEGEFINQSGVNKRGLWENGKRIMWIEDSLQNFQKLSPKEENNSVSSSSSLTEGKKMGYQGRTTKVVELH